jgi:hypothetical protein
MLADFAQGQAAKAADDDVFTEFGVSFFDDVGDGLVGVFYERLFQQFGLILRIAGGYMPMRPSWT